MMNKIMAILPLFAQDAKERKFGVNDKLTDGSWAKVYLGFAFIRELDPTMTPTRFATLVGPIYGIPVADLAEWIDT